MVDVIHIYVSLVGAGSLVARWGCLVFSEGAFCVFWIGWLLGFLGFAYFGYFGFIVLNLDVVGC